MTRVIYFGGALAWLYLAGEQLGFMVGWWPHAPSHFITLFAFVFMAITMLVSAIKEPT